MNSEVEMKEIQEFVGSLNITDDVTADELRTALTGAIKDRAIIFYYIWKKIKELHPEIDADRIMREASWNFGLVKGAQIAKKIGGTDKTTREVLKGQSSKGGLLVWRSEITELNDDKAVKNLYNCPHIEAFKDLGATPEEVKSLCRDMLCWGDYGMFAPFPGVKLEWPTTIADGEGKCCAMTLVKK